MAAASLTVRIAADLNDFSRQLNAMTKDVEHAAAKIEEVGKSMMEFITLPVLAATIELSKLGAEMEETAGRFGRSFGPAAEEVRTALEQVMKVVPKTSQELEKMAISANNMGKNLGMSAPKAALLSVQLMKMATELSAKTGVGFDETFEALQRGLEGATRGLRSLNIVIQPAEVEQEAYRLGILKTGQALDPLRKALATYSLLVKQSSQWHGEAAARAEDVAQQFRLLWRDVRELAEGLGTKLMPLLQGTVRMLQWFVDTVKQTPTWVIVVTASLLGFLAVLGPLVYAIAAVSKAIFFMNAALMVTKGISLAAWIAELASPIGWLIAGLTLLGALLAGAVYLYNKFWKSAKPPVDAKLTPPVSVEDLMGKLPPPEFTGSPVSRLDKEAGLLVGAFHAAEEAGLPIANLMERIGELNQKALRLYAAEHGELTEMAAAAQKIYNETNKILGTDIKIRDMIPGFAKMLSKSQMPDTMIATNIFAKQVDYQLKLRVQAAEDAAVDAFDVVAEAAHAFHTAVMDRARSVALRQAALARPSIVNVKEEAGLAFDEKVKATTESLDLLDQQVQLGIPVELTVRDALLQLKVGALGVYETFVKTKAQFAQQWGKGLGAAATEGVQAGLTGMMAALGPTALIVMAFGKVLQPIMTALDQMMEPLTALGKIIAIMLIPVMHPLFEALKLLGIATTLVAQVFYSIVAGIAHVVGGAIHAIGAAIAHIPFLGGVGRDIEKAGSAISAVGDMAQDMANQMAVARKELLAMKFGELANAANAVTSALLNVPSGFKVAYERYAATMPLSIAPRATGPQIGGTGGSSGGGSGGSGGGDAGGTTVILTVDGTTLAKAVVKNLQRQSQTRYGTTLRWAEVMP